MKHLFYLLAVCALAVGCCPCRNIESSTSRSDSVRVEYRERVEYVPDTVFLEIPLQSAERTTADSVSHLENEYAVSDARITADGLLFHDLQTKAQAKPIATQREIVTRDSVIYKDRYINSREKVQVPRALTAFQRFQMWGFWFLVLVIATGIFIYRKAKRSA